MPTPEEMAATMLTNLKAKTGKSLKEWLKITSASGLAKHGQLVAMLKADHGVTHGFANLIAHETLSGGPAVGEDLVAAQYAGKKAGLVPIYDAVIRMVKSLGSDVEIAPKKSYVSLRRSKQFALVQPSTATRVDLGLNLKGHATGDRLEASGSFNSMCSHRVRLATTADVDAQLAAWLAQAYEQA